MYQTTKGHNVEPCRTQLGHYNDVIMGAIASQITSLTIVYSTVYTGADQRKHESCASLAFARGLHRGPVNSPHKWPVSGKCFHLMTSSWLIPSMNFTWPLSENAVGSGLNDPQEAHMPISLHYMHWVLQLMNVMVSSWKLSPNPWKRHQ